MAVILEQVYWMPKDAWGLKTHQGTYIYEFILEPVTYGAWGVVEDNVDWVLRWCRDDIDPPSENIIATYTTKEEGYADLKRLAESWE